MTSRQWVDWELVVMGDIIVPVMVAVRSHAGEVGGTAAIAVAIFSVIVCNATILITVRLRNRREGLPTSRVFVWSAIGLAVVSACAAVWAIEAYPPRGHL